MYHPERPLGPQDVLDVLRSPYFTFALDTNTKNYTYKFFLRERRLPHFYPYLRLIRLRPRRK